MGIEPSEAIAVTTYLEDQLPALQGAATFPIATPQVLHGARTFWEKVTAVHAFITRHNAADHFRGGRREARSESRHWYDVNALHQHNRLGHEVLDRTDLRDLVIRVKQQQFAIGVSITRTAAEASCVWSRRETSCCRACGLRAHAGAGHASRKRSTTQLRRPDDEDAGARGRTEQPAPHSR